MFRSVIYYWLTGPRGRRNEEWRVSMSVYNSTLFSHNSVNIGYRNVLGLDALRGSGSRRRTEAGICQPPFSFSLGGYHPPKFLSTKKAFCVVQKLKKSLPICLKWLKTNPKLLEMSKNQSQIAWNLQKPTWWNDQTLQTNQLMKMVEQHLTII